jgi:periplasmic copper chaperone A
MMFTHNALRHRRHHLSLALLVGCAMAYTSSSAKDPAMSTAKTGPRLTVENPWVRATPPNAPVAAGYIAIRNLGKTGDRLLSATSPDAERVEIHDMTMNGGVMRMRKLSDGVAITAGSRVEFEPGGMHLMFITPKRRLQPGDRVTATLRFERAGAQEIRFEVRTTDGGAKHQH